MSVNLLERTDFIDLPEPVRGKVRDIFDLGDKLVLVTTDRISAYDSILPNGIPGKGIVLNRISEFWFNKTGDLIKNHLITTDVDDFPHKFHKYANELEGRSMLVKKTRPLEIECIVRGYLSGSGWNEYKDAETVCGIKLPEGLLESSKLETPVFTPSTKAVEGDHDENISFETACGIIGNELAETVREISINIYSMARDYAIDKGIIIADTKFEFGIEEAQASAAHPGQGHQALGLRPLRSRRPGPLRVGLGTPQARRGNARSAVLPGGSAAVWGQGPARRGKPAPGGGTAAEG